MVWKDDVAQEVDALAELADRNLVGMKDESPFMPQPLFDKRQQPAKVGRIVKQNNSVIYIANVVANHEFVFDKMIECVQVDIGK